MQDMEPEAQQSQSARYSRKNLRQKRADERRKNEQSTRTFFALLSFFMAIILLSVFLNAPLDSFSRLLVLASILVLGMLGVIMLERRRALQQMLTSPTADDDLDDFADNQPDDADDQGQQSSDEKQGADPITPFEQLVQEALDSIPEEFHEQMNNLVVLVKDEPDEEAFSDVKVQEGAILLGLYQGVPLTASGHYEAAMPERITIYQRNIEAVCHNDPERIRKQVRKTVLHEVAHHFGMSHRAMPIWVLGSADH